MPGWLKPVGTVVAVLLAALLIVGALGVPYRAVLPPQGYDQPRLHWNTKNSTRFVGGDAAEVASLVARAVYPSTVDANRPDLVILYDPANWQGGLAASSLVRPLNALLLPAGPAAQAEIERLRPRGSPALQGVQLLAIDGATLPQGELTGRQVASGEIPALLAQAGIPPRHALIVDPQDPATALLAAPWAAWSGDLILFEPTAAPPDIPRYALGNAVAPGVPHISGDSPAATAVRFAAYQDPANPLFGWGFTASGFGFNAEDFTGYRAYTLARPDDPTTALLSANLARRGKPGPLLWADERDLPPVVNSYLWTQRPAFWATPAEGPFHHFWVLGNVATISFPAQAQADYAVEIGPYQMKGAGLAGLEMLAAAWVVLGLASAGWIAFHEARFLPQESWVMRLAWPLLALTFGPFGIPLYWLAYERPVLVTEEMTLWDRPLWLQGLAATVSSVGFGGPLMVITGYLMWLFGLPLIPSQGPFFWLGNPMILQMIASFVVAVLVAWLLYQTPMIGMFHGISYGDALPRALPIVLVSMAAVALAMFPGMWWLMMWEAPQMPTEEATLWFGSMLLPVLLGFLIAWPFNYVLVRTLRKSGLM